MPVPRTLLLTPARPGEGNVAEKFLQDICLAFPRDRLVCFAAKGAGYDDGIRSPELDWLPLHTDELPNEWAGKQPGARLRAGVVQSLRRLMEIHRQCKLLAHKVIQLSKQSDIEQILAPIAGPATIYLARHVLNNLDVRFVPIIWDPIDYVADNRGYHRIAVSLIQREFAHLMKSAVRCGVASPGMKAEMEQIYGIHCEVIINSVVPLPPVERPMSDDYRIVFAGSLYARQEFQLFMSALNALDWKVAGRPLTLTLLGHCVDVPLTACGKKADIRYLGFWPGQQAQEHLRHYDLGYLPYWLDTKYSACVRQCFPNKLSLYLSAGLPIFYHGPEDSSVHRFMEKYPVGVSCSAVDVTALATAIADTVTDASLVERAAEARQAAIEQELGSQPSSQRLARLIGALPQELQTAPAPLSPAATAAYL